MDRIEHRTVETNGIRMHFAEVGSGPLVVLCHGFPESWYSWRHQLKAIADAGFHAVAPDMRGYGQTDAPEAIDRYTLLHLVGDIVGLIQALGEKHAVIAGHDWGAPVAWHSALLRPDIFRGVIGLSVPYRPRGPVAPTTLMPKSDDAVFYQLYFQTPGVAETEFERDPRLTVHAMLFWRVWRCPSPPAERAGRNGDPRRRLLRNAEGPLPLPTWLTKDDIDFYAGEFTRTGFRGGLNWYRNIDRNWELMAPFQGAKVMVPALYVAGDRDMVVAFRGMDQLIANLKDFVPQLTQSIILSGCGHWTQQERPGEVSKAMVGFLKTL